MGQLGKRDGLQGKTDETRYKVEYVKPSPDIGKGKFIQGRTAADRNSLEEIPDDNKKSGQQRL